MRTPASVTSLHDRFKCALTHRYFIRLHMTILILLVLLAGLLASRGLTHAGVRNMGLRYPIAVLFSYLVFFVLVRIWISYVCRASRSRRESASSSESSADLGDLFSDSGGSGGSTSGAGKLVEGGGRFGGGGSSASFADAQASTLQAAAMPAPRSGGSSSSSTLFLRGPPSGLPDRRSVPARASAFFFSRAAVVVLPGATSFWRRAWRSGPERARMRPALVRSNLFRT